MFLAKLVFTVFPGLRDALLCMHQWWLSLCTDFPKLVFSSPFEYRPLTDTSSALSVILLVALGRFISEVVVHTIVEVTWANQMQGSVPLINANTSCCVMINSSIQFKLLQLIINRVQLCDRDTLMYNKTVNTCFFLIQRWTEPVNHCEW